MAEKLSYKDHLSRVSRSFAFCIEELKEPLRHWIGLSYLLCRLVDTVEDAPWTDKSAQLNSYDQLLQFLQNNHVTDGEVREWTSAFPQNLPDGELLLLKEAPALLADFHALDEKPREYLSRTVLSMLRGMRHFSQAPELRLRNLQEVNEYCFFVAGVIGELLTDLMALCQPHLQVSSKQYLNSFHFGLFLQKVNVLKDQRGDEVEGRFLVYSREEILGTLRENAEHAFAYIESIPAELQEYRVFCAWCLFLGLISMPYIQTAYTNKKDFKIPRVETFLFLGKVKQLVDQPALLRELFVSKLNEVLPASQGVTKQRATTEEAWRLSPLYQGRLTNQEFLLLGLLL